MHDREQVSLRNEQACRRMLSVLISSWQTSVMSPLKVM
jgi:hypothetical protein